MSVTELDIIHRSVEYTSITMVSPPKKLSVEDRAAYLKDQARLAEEALLMDSNQRRLKQEGISRFEETLDSRSKRKRKDDDDDEVSVVTASKRPKAIQGHNAFDKSTHWNTPTKKRKSIKPTYISINNVGSPTSTIGDSPLAATRTRTNTSRVAIDSESDNDNDNSHKHTLIGSRVAVERELVTHFGTILSSGIVEGRTRYKIVYDDQFDEEEVNAIDLSRRQELYIKERLNDVVGQQKQKARAKVDDVVDDNDDNYLEIEINDPYVGTRVAFMHMCVAFYGTVKKCFVGSRKAKNWHIVYNNGDEEEILLAVLYQRQKLYAKEG